MFKDTIVFGKRIQMQNQKYLVFLIKNLDVNFRIRINFQKVKY